MKFQYLDATPDLRFVQPSHFDITSFFGDSIPVVFIGDSSLNPNRAYGMVAIQRVKADAGAAAAATAVAAAAFAALYSANLRTIVYRASFRGEITLQQMLTALCTRRYSRISWLSVALLFSSQNRAYNKMRQ